MLAAVIFHDSELKMNPFNTLASEILQHILMFLTYAKHNIFDSKISYIEARQLLDSLFCCKSMYEHLQTILLSNYRINYTMYKKLESCGKLITFPKRMIIRGKIKNMFFDNRTCE